ncbi:hypothetical protein ILYODFUR_036447 [Ilyodon furcidens]|uniref:Uncharacterized protein n=1 Tax=Ilyodon furcidens TaxID=33524 RepID=A0ABV0UZE0_9TELE
MKCWFYNCDESRLRADSEHFEGQQATQGREEQAKASCVVTIGIVKAEKQRKKFTVTMTKYWAITEKPNKGLTSETICTIKAMPKKGTAVVSSQKTRERDRTEKDTMVEVVEASSRFQQRNSMHSWTPTMPGWTSVKR